MKDKTPENEPSYYQNGQSDAEKLMRRHLQNPDDVITDDELKNLKITGVDEPAEDSQQTEEENNTTEEPIKPATPWDVIDG